LGCLRYTLGGDRPSQTDHQAVSLSPIQGTRLDFKLHKAGISTAAPRYLAAPSQSLPAILHMRNLKPLPRYSQGSWGLSVQVWGIGIFTNTAISSSLWRRQRPSRYTIRAGRNLPDKEFRYLRTVIVTPLTSPVNLPAPGTCQSTYFHLRVCVDLCFW
jgi:hypothetical protein